MMMPIVINEDDFGDKIVMVMMTTAAILEISSTSPSLSLIFTNMNDGNNYGNYF